MGFKYIDPEYVIQLPEYTLFSADSERVEDIIDFLKENNDD